MGDIASVSVHQPDDMLTVVRDLAQEREVRERARVPIRQIYDEAVVALLDDLRRGTKIHFAPTPAMGTTRRTVWLRPETMAEMKQWAHENNIRAATFVLTALLRYFSRRGITFENFPKV